MKQRLFTPGPLTTDIRVRRAMLADWGSRDARFIALTARIRAGLLAVANGAGSHTAIPIQGSGTFVLEAAVATLVGPEHKLLVLVNGAYGARMAAIATRMGRAVATLDWPEDAAIDLARTAAALAADSAITHVAVVHCETTTGIVNPIEPIAAAVRAAGRVLIVDAMAGFGALPIDLAATPIGAVLASSNKCLEGPPGIAFALVETGLIAEAAQRSPSLSLDLHDQWRGFESNGQWRFTPPVQVAAGLAEALRLLDEEGGPPARLARYGRRFGLVRDGLERLGHRLYLADAVQGPIIATFRPAPDRPFDFAALYARLADQGLLIYPGKLTAGPSFRIGCIGALEDADFAELVAAFADAENTDPDAPAGGDPASAPAVETRPRLDDGRKRWALVEVDDRSGLPFEDGYNPGEERDEHGRWTGGAAHQFIRHAAAGKAVQRAHVLGEVGPGLAGHLGHLGHDGAGKTITLEHDRARHILAHHGRMSELLRGQRPVTHGDLAAAHDLLNGATSTQKGSPSTGRQGHPRFEAISMRGGVTYTIVGEVRKRTVTVINMWKKGLRAG